MLEKHLWKVSLYSLIKILQLLYEISSFLEMLYKKHVLKIFLKFTDKLKKQSSGGALSKDIVKKFAKFTEKHFCWNFFLIKLQAGNCQKQPLDMFSKIRCSEYFRKFHRKFHWRAYNFTKRVSNTDAFLWNLKTFLEQMFWRTSVNGCV